MGRVDNMTVGVKLTLGLLLRTEHGWKAHEQKGHTERSSPPLKAGGGGGWGSAHFESKTYRICGKLRANGSLASETRS